MDQEALDRAEGLDATPSNIASVSRDLGEERARWAFLQWELRKRARTKFALADRMFFTREALEQSTTEALAAYHASQFPPDVLVADLTTGIGADLVALAKRGPVIGFELDPERARYARANLHAHGLVGDVREEDSLTDEWPFDYAIADPARRVEGRRTLQLDAFSPDPHALSQRFRTLKHGLMKLSPMLRDEDLLALGQQVEFVSYGGECREALVSCGTQPEPGVFAVHVESGERLPKDNVAPIAADRPAECLFEADPAAIRGHTLGALCSRHALQPLGDSNGYLTGSEPVQSPWLRPYSVLYSGKGDLKQTREALRKLDAKVTVVKQRGADQDVRKLAAALSKSGTKPVTLVVWTIAKSVRHTIVTLS